ncbi:MAG: DUF2058 domain-containing protein [Pseudomonadota bacterium]
MPSLKDQLLKAGLVDEKKAKQIEKQKRKQAKQTPKGQVLENEARELARQTQAERAAKDKEINRQHQFAAEQKAIAAQIKQLIDTNRIERKDGDIAYQFSHNRKIKKLYVNQLQQLQLINGVISIVRNNDKYELVPAIVADKIKQRDESVVLVLNVAGKTDIDEEDPYADYQIPDDLMW